MSDMRDGGNGGRERWVGSQDRGARGRTCGHRDFVCVLAMCVLQEAVDKGLWLGSSPWIGVASI